jgi:GMP synthase-like glutamine amidotransferase
MRALLIANAGDADAGFVGQRFEEYDFSFAHVVREYPNEWPSIDGIDLVVHLGSNWSVYWDDVSRNVAAESELIREAHRRGIPLFGICFGAQIMAHALGGSAERAKKAEIGWHDVIATPTYKVLAGTWMQWHYDTFSAPAGAQVLALSDAGPQAMQVGRSFGTRAGRDRPNAKHLDRTNSQRGRAVGSSCPSAGGLVLGRGCLHANAEGKARASLVHKVATCHAVLGAVVSRRMWPK